MSVAHQVQPTFDVVQRDGTTDEWGREWCPDCGCEVAMLEIGGIDKARARPCECAIDPRDVREVTPA